MPMERFTSLRRLFRVCFEVGLLFRLGFTALCAILFLSVPTAGGALLPFPLTAGQRGTVTCLETPVTYDIYLPPAYSTNGMALPILYTFHPSGGGEVGQFQSVCGTLNIIAVGITGFQNGVSWDKVYKEYFAVTRDIRQRVLFDPSAEFLAGFSGGGEASYVCSRARPQHVAGVFAMGGWLGRTSQYYSTDRVQTNLMAARATGNSDTSALYYLVPDAMFLGNFNAVIRDWQFSGGHAIAPDATKSECLTWLVTNRVPARPNARANAQARANDWQWQLAAGEKQAVLKDCVQTLMTQPRSWAALQAQIALDEIAASFESFRNLDMENLAAGDCAADMFYFLARAAKLNNDVQRYRSWLKALTGVTDTSGDRAGNIRSLLLTNGFPAPIVRIKRNADASHTVWTGKDAPGLNFSAQIRTNLSLVWQDAAYPVSQTSTHWSFLVTNAPGLEAGFFRIGASPANADPSPPEPP